MADLPASCATHPGQTAWLECDSCGRPTCEYCGHLCAGCRHRSEGGGVIAWERGDLSAPARLLRTVRDVLAYPGRTFGELEQGSTAAGLLYVVVVHAITGLAVASVMVPTAMLVAMGSGMARATEALLTVPVLLGVVFAAPVAFAVQGLILTLLAGLLHHTAVSAAGGNPQAGTSIRATGYASTVVVFWGALAPALLLPTLGPVVAGTVYLAQLLWIGRVLSIVAGARQGLQGGRALLAGWLPSLLALVLTVAFVVITMAAGEAAEPSRAPDRYGRAAPSPPTGSDDGRRTGPRGSWGQRTCSFPA